MVLANIFFIYMRCLVGMSTAVIRLTGGFPIFHYHVGGGIIGCGMAHGFAKCMGGHGHLLLKVYASKEWNTLEGEGLAEGKEEEEEFSLSNPRVVEARRKAINSPEMQDLLKTIGCIEEADIEKEAELWESKKVHPPQWPPQKRSPAFSVDGKSEESIFNSLVKNGATTPSEPPLPARESGQKKIDPVVSQPDPQDRPPPK